MSELPQKVLKMVIDYMLALRIDPLGAVIALSVALGLVVGIEMGRRCK